MQNSYMYRRGVVVALNEEAEQNLLENDVDENTAVDFYEFQDEDVFYGLIKRGFFEAINIQLETMIDDYEEERIGFKNLNTLRKIIIEFERVNNLCSSEKESLYKLIKLCDVAIKNNSSVFFIL